MKRMYSSIERNWKEVYVCFLGHDNTQTNNTAHANTENSEDQGFLPLQNRPSTQSGGKRGDLPLVDSESRGNVTNAITCINTQIEPINLHFFVQLAKNLLQELA